MKVVSRVEFEMAHRLHLHEGPKRQVHGHHYIVDVTIDGDVKRAGPESGTVIDRDALGLVLAQFVQRFDHRTMLYFEDPLFLYLNEPALHARWADLSADSHGPRVDEWGIDGMQFIPTVENITQYFANILADQDIGVCEIAVHETPVSSAVAEPQPKCDGVIAYRKYGEGSDIVCGVRGWHKPGCPLA